MPKTLHNLQALRGVACLMVVCFHVWAAEAAYRAETPGFREVRWFGFAGVDLFFALSGFVITTAHLGDLGRPRAVPRYLFRRAWRIYPPFWAVLVPSVAVGVGLLGMPVLGPGWELKWLQWVLLVPGGPPNPVQGPAWTLTYEMMFYVVFAAAIALPRRVGWLTGVVWAAVVLSARSGWTGDDPYLAAVTSPLVLEFLGGCAAAWLVRRGVAGGQWTAALGVAWAVVAVVLVSGAAGEEWGAVMARHPPRVLVFGPAAVLIVYGAASAEVRGTLRAPRWLRAVGDASYSIYLFHTPALVVVMYYGWRMSHQGPAHYAWMAAAFAACVGGGFAFHRLVERPLLNLARRRPRPAPAEAPPAPLRRAA